MKITFEVSPSDKLKLASIPGNWGLSITCTASEIQPTLDLYRKLGGKHTPHVSAALVEDETHAKSLAIHFDKGVFLIGGDHKPRGPFDRAAKLIPYFQHGQAIGVAGYPEGHPSYPHETLGDEILLEKQALGATYVATQMCFNPQAVVDWAKRIRDKGVTLSIYCGVAPPLSVIKLTQFALRCGVNTSLNFLEKMAIQDAVKLIRRYDPRPLMETVYDHVDGFHIFTFNAIRTTSQWVAETAWLKTLIE